MEQSCDTRPSEGAPGVFEGKRLILRTVYASVGGALGGVVFTFVFTILVCTVFWQVYRVTTAANSWPGVFIVSATIAGWMTIEGVTTGIWLTVWLEIRRGRHGTACRLTAIGGFVALTLFAHEFSSWIVHLTYPKTHYVTAMHQTFSLALGAIALYEPLAKQPGLRALSMLFQSTAAGFVMAIVLECLGNEDVVTVGNFVVYSASAYGILIGIWAGHVLADRAWAGGRGIERDGGAG